MAEKRKAPESDTKNRILDAAERLYVEHGVDGVSLRPVTAAARANLAAVNYHFGSRDNLLRAMLERRLDPLNAARDRLLDACEARWGERLACEHMLAALFVPALHQAREAGESGYERMRFLGRVYSDASPLVTGLLKSRYDATQRRFLAGFARSLPELALPDLKLRLSFVMKAVAGVVAGSGLREVLVAFGRDGTDIPTASSEIAILASFGNLMAGALMAPARTDARLRIFDDVFSLSGPNTDRPEGVAASLQMDAAE
ncbi:AcrR family transcriptional regulator [Endobacter medicaginis]|uniref:AcrR family transcriptional regulator n=1 Tax=Endobacter medicaginis TaxID=1181271 RepID=A0A839V2Q4_9PROT|nr:TetR/AcrR family transcriptional regulator [Endobacter medicaginis]MBB3173862.1 AcrR family transcriptional regulator [Endobacter medicaginis]MCX5476144.1 TetR/AcrR family transcriptional regulator [Endobacter medicaginis]NVN29165.1 TetR/AcrR family transcriptional regulator [Endobacter medicaginis]